jgi:hypothetical protein
VERTRLVRYAVAFIAAGVFSAGAVGVAVAADGGQQPFTADSGDQCQYGTTRGILGPGTSPRLVHVGGVLVDRPVSSTTSALCVDDRRISVLTLTAYAGNRVVDSERIHVDNNTRDYKVSLVNAISTARIDRVTVRICRQGFVEGPLDYCGATVTVPVAQV